MQTSKDNTTTFKNWNGKLLQSTINDVISGLNKSECKKIQLFLFAPYFIEGINPGYSFNENDPEGSVQAKIKENEGFNKFLLDIDFNNTAIRNYVVQFFNTACPRKTFTSSYSVSQKVYVKDIRNVIDYINNYAITAESDIAELEEEGVYAVYILPIDLVKNTDFKTHIPFKHCILY